MVARGDGSRVVDLTLLGFALIGSAQAETDAKFYSLTLTSSPGGVATVSPAGATFAAGTQVLLTATADPGWTFYRWQGTVPPGAGQQNPLALTMDKNHQISASFIRKTYTLATAVNGNGIGAVYVTPDLPAYNHGDSINIRAIADPASKFDGWHGNLSGSNADATLIITKNSAVTATFSLLPVRLDLFKDGSGDGQMSADPPGPLHPVGETITISAVPDELSALVAWSGAISGNDLTETLVITEHSVVTATFDRIRFLLDVNATPGGNVTRLPDQPSYPTGQTVSVSATPDLGWRFVEWQGDLAGEAASLSLTINTDIKSTAVFTQIIYSIKTATIGMGSVVLNPNRSGYTYGEQVAVTAVADPGWLFKQWYGSFTGGQASRNLVITDNQNITAEFVRIHTLDIAQIGQGTVTISPQKPYYFPGENVTLEAAADSGWQFMDWSGDVGSADDRISFVIEDDLTITATFKQLFPLTIDIQGNGSVDVRPLVEPAIYIDGDTVKLRAFPDPGWRFAGWRDDLVDGNATVTVVMEKPMEVTARFAQNTYELQLIADGRGAVTTDPPGPYVYDEVVALIAVSAWNWKLLGWSRSVEYDPEQIFSTDTVAIVRVTEDAAYVAHFLALPWTLYLPQVVK